MGPRSAAAFPRAASGTVRPSLAPRCASIETSSKLPIQPAAGDVSTTRRLTGRADSVGQCNAFRKHSGRCAIVECFAWPGIELVRDAIQLAL